VHVKRRNRASQNSGGDGSVFRPGDEGEKHSRNIFATLCSTCAHMLVGAMGKQSQTVFLTLLNRWNGSKLKYFYTFLLRSYQGHVGD
jgi:hypothetical protein